MVFSWDNAIEWWSASVKNTRQGGGWDHKLTYCPLTLPLNVKAVDTLNNNSSKSAPQVFTHLLFSCWNKLQDPRTTRVSLIWSTIIRICGIHCRSCVAAGFSVPIPSSCEWISWVGIKTEFTATHRAAAAVSTVLWIRQGHHPFTSDQMI